MLMREIDREVRETGGAGAMLVDLLVDIIGVDSLRTVGQ